MNPIKTLYGNEQIKKAAPCESCYKFSRRLLSPLVGTLEVCLIKVKT